jgi:hypothetical protein
MIHFFRNNPVRPACFTYLYSLRGPRGLKRGPRDQSCGDRRHD